MNRKSALCDNKKYEAILAAALLVLGFALRILFLEALPAGLNQDEASAGYDAWALFHYGIDRCGSAAPVLLVAWGSGQNVLLSYLAMPLIAVFGLTPFAIRLPMALCGCGALALFWRFARRARGPRFGLCALFFLAVNPWHIMACRWALESNLLPSFLMAGLYFTSRAAERPWFLVPAAACFGLALYAYGTAFFFLPLFLILCVIWLRKTIRPASFLTALAVFLAIALPIALCQLRNALGLPEMQFLGLTLPRLTEARQAATSVFGGGGLSAALGNFGQLLKLLLTQSDGLPWNSVPGGGLYFFFGLPLFLLGLVVAIRRRSAPEAPMLFALCASLLAAFFIDVNINRINILWLPMLYFAALGLDWIVGATGRFSPVAPAGVALCCALFLVSYWNRLGGDGYTGFFPGLGEAIEYVQQQEPESAFVSYHVNQPYIFVLFYTETPPGEFLRSVDYLNPEGAFRWVRSFGRWRFASAEQASGEYLILHESEVEGRNILAVFGEYVVCAGET